MLQAQPYHGGMGLPQPQGYGGQGSYNGFPRPLGGGGMAAPLAGGGMVSLPGVVGMPQPVRPAPVPLCVSDYRTQHRFPVTATGFVPAR